MASFPPQAGIQKGSGRSRDAGTEDGFTRIEKYDRSGATHPNTLLWILATNFISKMHIPKEDRRTFPLRVKARTNSHERLAAIGELFYVPDWESGYGGLTEYERANPDMDRYATCTEQMGGYFGFSETARRRRRRWLASLFGVMYALIPRFECH